MNMFQNTGEFTPDSLIASNEFPILKEGIGIKAGQGVLKRGTLIVKGTDKAGRIAGTTNTDMTVFGILTDNIDTGSDDSAENIPMTCYITGVFNRDAVAVKTDATIDTYEDDMKGIGMYLRNVQKY
ncbi:hypothetical protein [Anaerocolumna xylanovorans]|uniref:Bacteriophage lambda head decoration protein D n=1 Tax=Anaerocolumna xylanovorans DSM 12503 TaxID=1121345 RepID=A0A1M7YBR5_9FIRM|nr:hypothetical protein [Anaerocolumna xylanovorans]SHO50077.1 hypothetical protein SAMN02745217_02577 [Anaerocolumna xylanovorans DSM 12503]